MTTADLTLETMPLKAEEAAALDYAAGYHLEGRDPEGPWGTLDGDQLETVGEQFVLAGRLKKAAKHRRFPLDAEALELAVLERNAQDCVRMDSGGGLGDEDLAFSQARLYWLRGIRENAERLPEGEETSHDHGYR